MGFSKALTTLTGGILTGVGRSFQAAACELAGKDRKSYVVSTAPQPKKPVPVDWIHYKDMYIQCDIFNAAVNRTAFGCIAGGYNVVIVDGEPSPPDKQVTAVKEFFEEPNEEQDMVEILSDIFRNLKIYGNAYLEVKGDANKIAIFKQSFLKGNEKDERLPVKIYSLNPKNMRVKTDDDGHGLIEGYYQEVNGKPEVTFKASEIIHFKLWSDPDEEAYGLAPARSLLNAVAADIFLSEYNGKFFENNATPRLHIAIEGVDSEDDLKAIADRLEAELKGSAHKNLITGSGWTVEPIGLKNTDMEFSKFSKNVLHRILAVLGTQPIMIGLTEDKTEPEVQLAIFKAYTVRPLQKMVESKINRKLIRPLFGSNQIKFKFNETDLVDAKLSKELDAQDLKNAVMTVDEKRKARGLGPVSWGKTPIIAFSNMERAQVKSPDEKKEAEKDNEA